MRHFSERVASFGLLLAAFLTSIPAHEENEKRLTELAKEASEWAYPGATNVSSGEAEGVMRQAVMMTTDEWEKVIKYYEKKSGQFLDVKKGEAQSGIYQSGTEATKAGERCSSILADDSGMPPDPKKQGAPPRGVMIRLLTQCRAKYFVTVMISHTDKEKETHVVVTYIKK